MLRLEAVASKPRMELEAPKLGELRCPYIIDRLWSGSGLCIWESGIGSIKGGLTGVLWGLFGIHHT
jgi:hypothetical protein